MNRKYIKAAGVLICTCTLLYFILYPQLTSSQETREANLDKKTNKTAPPLAPIVYSARLDILPLFSSYFRFIQLSTNNDVQIQRDQWIECSRDPSFLRLYTDVNCLFIWLRILESQQITEISMITAVSTINDTDTSVANKPMSNGGFKGEFPLENSSGYWKPCLIDTGNQESYLSEILAFHVDRLMGFYHTPPVVPRIISVNELLSLAEKAGNNTDEKAVQKIHTIIAHCEHHDDDDSDDNEDKEKGDERGDYFTTNTETERSIEGALVGWSNYNLRVLFNPKQPHYNFVRFSELSTREDIEVLKAGLFNVSDSSDPEQVSTVIEILSIHLFAVLTGNLHKFDHNLFQVMDNNGNTVRYGPYIYIDNDRAQWRWKTSRSGFLRGLNPLSKICKFPRDIAERILFLRSDNSENNNSTSLGSFLLHLTKEVYQPRMKAPELFSEAEAAILDANVDYLASLIDHCAHKYGYDNIMLTEPWSSPTVTHFMNVFKQHSPRLTP